MKTKSNGQATDLIKVFTYNQESTSIRVQVVNNEPWFVAKDVCDVLDHSNHKMAIKALDEDEVSSVYLTDALGRKQDTKVVNESGLYSLIFQSRKPEAKSFRKWVTSEVLPAIRKNGYYGLKQTKQDYIDARDGPYSRKKVNGIEVRCVTLNGEDWYSMNDIHRIVGSSTGSSQAAKKLNLKQTLAKKILLGGLTNPAWFVTMLGMNLLLSGSKKYQEQQQLDIKFG